MDLKHSLTRLRESSTRLEVHKAKLPSELRPFVELVHAQTAVLEAFIVFEKKFKLTKRQYCRSKDRQDRRAPLASKHEDHHAEILAPSHEILRSPQFNSAETRQVRPLPPTVASRHEPGGGQSKPTSQSMTPVVQPAVDDALLPRLQATVYKAEPSKLSSKPKPAKQKPKHLAHLVQAPYQVTGEQQGSLPTPVIPGTFPLTPRLPYDGSSITPVSQENDLETTSGARGHSLHKKTSPLMAQSVKLQVSTATESLAEQSSTDSADEICEAHLQEALSNLITSMKERKKVPVGRLEGSFILYSTDFQKCLIRPIEATANSERRLSIFASALNWSQSLPDVAPPSAIQLAMELYIHPACHFVILPFTPPKNAGLKWHSLKAINLRQECETCTLEVMYPGDGFIKLKIRLSQVIGETGSASNEQPDKFIEFSGIWQNTNIQDGGHLLNAVTHGEKHSNMTSRPPSPGDRKSLGHDKAPPSLGAVPLPRLQTEHLRDARRPHSLSTLGENRASELTFTGSSTPVFEQVLQLLSNADTKDSISPSNTATPSISPPQRGRADTASLRRSGGLRRPATPKRSRSQESELLPASHFWSPVSPP